MITIIEATGGNHWAEVALFETETSSVYFRPAWECLNAGQGGFPRKAILGNNWLTGEPVECEMFCDYKTFHEAVVDAAS